MRQRWPFRFSLGRPWRRGGEGGFGRCCRFCRVRLKLRHLALHRSCPIAAVLLGLCLFWPKDPTSIGGPISKHSSRARQLVNGKWSVPAIGKMASGCASTPDWKASRARDFVDLVDFIGLRSPECCGRGAKGLDCFRTFSSEVLCVILRSLFLFSSLARVLTVRGLSNLVPATC